MPIFAVRSLDGQLGVVVARNKVDAVERLDEFANFEGCPIRELPELMLLLDMDDAGQFRLEHIGEQMDSAIRTFGYPLVEKVFDDVLDQQVHTAHAVDRRRSPEAKGRRARATGSAYEPASRSASG